MKRHAREDDSKARLEDATARLEAVGTAWAAARDSEREIAGTAYEAVRAGAEAGLSEVRIAQLLGVNRTTVRTALGK